MSSLSGWIGFNSFSRGKWICSRAVLRFSVVHLDFEDFSEELLQCLLCHKEPARSKQKAPSWGLWMRGAGSLWHKRHWQQHYKALYQWEPSLVEPRPMRVDHTVHDGIIQLTDEDQGEPSLMLLPHRCHIWPWWCPAWIPQPGWTGPGRWSCAASSFELLHENILKKIH